MTDHLELGLEAIADLRWRVWQAGLMRGTSRRLGIFFGVLVTVLLIVSRTALAGNISIIVPPNSSGSNSAAFAYTQAAPNSPQVSFIEGGGTSFYDVSTNNPSYVSGTLNPGSAFAQVTSSVNSISISTGATSFGVAGTTLDLANGQSIVYFSVDQTVAYTLTDSSAQSLPVGLTSGSAYGWNNFGLEDSNHNNIVQDASYGGTLSFTGQLLANQIYDIHLQSQAYSQNGDPQSASAMSTLTFTIGPDVDPSAPAVNPSGANSVPEPSTFALLSLGGIGLAVAAYRRGRAAV